MKSLIAASLLAGAAIAAPVASSTSWTQYLCDNPAHTGGLQFFTATDPGNPSVLPDPKGENWTHLYNQDRSVYRCGSYSYTADPFSMACFSPQGQATNPTSFTIWAGKKNDRGVFNVYRAGIHPGQLDLIGSGDAYADTTGPNGEGTPSQALFTYEIPADTSSTFCITPSGGIDGRTHSHAFIGIDQVTYTFA